MQPLTRTTPRPPLASSITRPLSNTIARCPMSGVCLCECAILYCRLHDLIGDRLAYLVVPVGKSITRTFFHSCTYKTDVSLAIQAYDTVIGFDRELECIWRKKPSFVSVLYLFHRYATLLVYALSLYGESIAVSSHNRPLFSRTLIYSRRRSTSIFLVPLLSLVGRHRRMVAKDSLSRLGH